MNSYAFEIKKKSTESNDFLVMVDGSAAAHSSRVYQCCCQNRNRLPQHTSRADLRLGTPGLYSLRTESRSSTQYLCMRTVLKISAVRLCNHPFVPVE